MTTINNMIFWLENEEGMPAMGGDAAPPEVPRSQDPMAGVRDLDMDDDMSSDPMGPDMLDDAPGDGGENDFNVWRAAFFKSAVKADAAEMLDMIRQILGRRLKASERRFVEDNLAILMLRQDPHIAECSKQIRKLINQELDRNHPGVSLMTHITQTLPDHPIVRDALIKMVGQGGFKAELHRRWVAALLGAVQTGGGSDKQDLIYVGEDFTIDISTRFYTQFGDISVGGWSLQEDDPSSFLKDPELERLQEGSPEEKHVLRRRVCLQSIAAKYGKRAFLVHVFEPDELLLHSFGWDVKESLGAGYKTGRLVVRKNKSRRKDAMIDDNGEVIKLFSYSINFKQDTGEVLADGMPETKEVAFLEQRQSNLFIVAGPAVIQQLVSGSPGMFYHSTGYEGTATDFANLIRCVPSTVEMLMRRCQ